MHTTNRTTDIDAAIVAAMVALARTMAGVNAPPPRRQGPTPELVAA